MNIDIKTKNANIVSELVESKKANIKYIITIALYVGITGLIITSSLIFIVMSIHRI